MDAGGGEEAPVCGRNLISHYYGTEGGSMVVVIEEVVQLTQIVPCPGCLSANDADEDDHVDGAAP